MVEIDGIPTNVLLAAGYRTISDTANYEDGSKQVPIANLSSSLVNVLGWRWKQNANGYFWQNFYTFTTGGSNDFIVACGKGNITRVCILNILVIIEMFHFADYIRISQGS